MRKTPLKRGTSQLKRSGFKRSVGGAKRPLGAAKRKKVSISTKTTQKGYKPPKWFSSLKPGSHGYTPSQKKYWKAISDFYRQEDFEAYRGRCPICQRSVENWSQLQLGHFHRYSLCNGWMKFERKNLLGICSGCNQNDGGLTSIKFANALKAKYGEDIIDWIETENEKHRGEKINEWELVDKLTQLRPDLVR